MKPFDLEAAKRGEPIVTRDGRKAKFVAYVPEAANEMIVCLIGGDIFLFQKNGAFVHSQFQDQTDLFMAPPPMRSINGYEYPEPVREPLEVGQSYWVVDPYAKLTVTSMKWIGGSEDMRLSQRSLIHLTREAAEAHARAIILAGGGEV